MSEAAVLVFVHGIGRQRDADTARLAWTTALAEGARRSGHTDFADALDVDVDVAFADYNDLMVPEGAQGGLRHPSDEEADFLLALVDVLVDELSEGTRDPATTRALVEAKAQLGTVGAQGAGEIVRVLSAALTSVMRIPGLRRAGQWTSEQRLLGALAQVGRYLRRGAPEAGQPLDVRVRERVLAALPDDRPVVVVAHSLGSVVAFEALHSYSREVRLLVTLGSPLATAAVVFDRLRPPPPTTPPTVRRWLNFWDRDDVVVARPRLERLIKANADGVLAVSDRVDSDGLWVHSATKYLAQAGVAGPIAEALGR